MQKNRLQTGNSRDELSLTHEGKKHIVAKKFTSNLLRAKLNIKKQKDYQELKFKDVTIKAVNIEKEYEEGNSYIVTMPYIDGIVGSDYGKFGTNKIAKRLNVGLDAARRLAQNAEALANSPGQSGIDLLECIRRSRAVFSSQVDALLGMCIDWLPHSNRNPQ